jgi:hypothetical protein
MKRGMVYMITMAMLAMTGCLVSSLHPFYKEKDKYYDPVMAGSWMDEDSCLWTIEPNMVSESFMGEQVPDQSYLITYYEETDKAGTFIGTLFRINGITYVDFYPEPDEEHCVTELTCWHHFPTHTLARVQYNSDSILLYWFGEEWLNDLLEQNRIRIKHETLEVSSDYSRHVLTASTDELQKFIRKYANDPKTSDEIEEIFARGYTEDNEEYGVFLKLKPSPQGDMGP